MDHPEQGLGPARLNPFDQSSKLLDDLASLILVGEKPPEGNVEKLGDTVEV